MALGVKVKVMRWDWDRELLTGRTLGLVTEVHHGPGVCRGPGGQGQGQRHVLELPFYVYFPLCTTIQTILEVVYRTCRNHSSWKTVPDIHNALTEET